MAEYSMRYDSPSTRYSHGGRYTPTDVRRSAQTLMQPVQRASAPQSVAPTAGPTQSTSRGLSSPVTGRSGEGTPDFREAQPGAYSRASVDVAYENEVAKDFAKDLTYSGVPFTDIKAPTPVVAVGQAALQYGPKMAMDYAPQIGLTSLAMNLINPMTMAGAVAKGIAASAVRQNAYQASDKAYESARQMGMTEDQAAGWAAGTGVQTRENAGAIESIGGMLSGEPAQYSPGAQSRNWSEFDPEAPDYSKFPNYQAQYSMPSPEMQEAGKAYGLEGFKSDQRSQARLNIKQQFDSRRSAVDFQKAGWASSMGEDRAKELEAQFKQQIDMEEAAAIQNLGGGGNATAGSYSGGGYGSAGSRTGPRSSSGFGGGGGAGGDMGGSGSYGGKY